MMTLKATAKLLPEGMQVETEARGFKILMDEPADFGGTDKGITPGEAIMTALGGCQAIVAKMMAQKLRMNLEGFRVEIEGDFDPEGLAGKPGVPVGFQEFRYKMFFQTDATQEQVDKLVKLIEKSCPVGDTLQRPISLVFAGAEIE